MIVTGAARFAQPIYGSIQGSKDINQVASSSTIPDSYYIIISDGTSLKSISFANLINTIISRIGIDPTKDYLFDN